MNYFNLENILYKNFTIAVSVETFLKLTIEHTLTPIEHTHTY
jgi:hypothetical protein